MTALIAKQILKVAILITELHAMFAPTGIIPPPEFARQTLPVVPTTAAHTAIVAQAVI